MTHRMRRGLLLALIPAACSLAGCGRMDTGVGHTAGDDYTLTLQVTNRFLQVGDQSLLRVTLKRTDNSNLDDGLDADIALYASAHGQLETSSVPVHVADATTPEFSTNVRYTATGPGVAEVRATFKDATAAVEILVSQGDF